MTAALGSALQSLQCCLLMCGSHSATRGLVGAQAHNCRRGVGVSATNVGHATLALPMRHTQHRKRDTSGTSRAPGLQATPSRRASQLLHTYQPRGRTTEEDVPATLVGAPATVCTNTSHTRCVLGKGTNTGCRLSIPTEHLGATNNSWLHTGFHNISQR